MDAYLERVLQAIPVAATNPLALIAYILALGVWFAIAWRVKRNRQLLSAILNIPENQRAQLLEAEMGVAHLKVGLDAQTWLRSRRHTYYLIAFIVACLTLIIVVVLALWTSPKRSNLTPASAAPYLRADDLAILPYIQIGAARQFIEYHAGPPQIEDTNPRHRVAYAFPKYYLVIIYNDANEVRTYSVTIRDDSVRVQFKWCDGDVGDVTFAAACRHRSCSPAYFDYNYQDWLYLETIFPPGVFEAGEGFIAFTESGVDFGNDDRAFANADDDALYRAIAANKPALTKAEKQAVDRYRSGVKPNTFGETSTSPLEGVDYDGADILEVLVDKSMHKRLG